MLFIVFNLPSVYPLVLYWNYIKSHPQIFYNNRGAPSLNLPGKEKEKQTNWMFTGQTHHFRTESANYSENNISNHLSGLWSLYIEVESDLQLKDHLGVEFKIEFLPSRIQILNCWLARFQTKVGNLIWLSFCCPQFVFNAYHIQISMKFSF